MSSSKFCVLQQCMHVCIGQGERQVAALPEEAGSHPSASPLLQQPHLAKLLCSLHPVASFMSADACDIYYDFALCARVIACDTAECCLTCSVLPRL